MDKVKKKLDAQLIEGTALVNMTLVRLKETNSQKQKTAGVEREEAAVHFTSPGELKESTSIF